MKKRDGERYTVLVIEDNDHIRKLVEQILRSEGYETVSACGGREGLNCFRQGHPDIVLCDVMMPEVDGFDVLKEIRKEPRGLYLPFVFLTGKGSRDDVRSGMNLGADDYLMKPVTAGELIETVETRLRLNEARSGRAGGDGGNDEGPGRVSPALIGAPACRADYVPSEGSAERTSA